MSGVVDRATVGSVTEAVRDELAHCPAVEVDTRGVERWEDDALGALAACARLGAGVEILMEGRGRSDREGGPTGRA